MNQFFPQRSRRTIFFLLLRRMSGGEARHPVHHLGGDCRRSAPTTRPGMWRGGCPRAAIYREHFIESSACSTFHTRSTLGLCYLYLVSFVTETYHQTRIFWSVFLHTPPLFCVSRISHPRPLLHLPPPPSSSFLFLHISHCSPLFHFLSFLLPPPTFLVSSNTIILLLLVCYGIRRFVVSHSTHPPLSSSSSPRAAFTFTIILPLPAHSFLPAVINKHTPLRSLDWMDG
jgi:hypothetical protein